MGNFLEYETDNLDSFGRFCKSVQKKDPIMDSILHCFGAPRRVVSSLQ